jgi:hypothetical protein
VPSKRLIFVRSIQLFALFPQRQPIAPAPVSWGIFVVGVPMPKPRRYPWPASRLRGPEMMHELHLLSIRSSTPITVLIHNAVVEHINRAHEARSAAAPAPIGFAVAAS